MDYQGKIFEGIWVHRTEEESKSLEVTSCDYHRKIVKFADDTTMGMESFYKNYMYPRLEGMDLGHFEKESILGGLAKENNQPREIKEPYKDDVQIVIEKASEVIPVNNTATVVVKEVSKGSDLSPEQRMLFDSINLTKGTSSTVNQNISIEFDFDINKIIKMSTMFDISSDDVVKVILESESGGDVLKKVLSGIVDSLSKE